MSEVNLLVMGCAVSFIALAGAYVYLRESFSAHESASEGDQSSSGSAPSAKPVEPDLREVA